MKTPKSSSKQTSYGKGESLGGPVSQLSLSQAIAAGGSVVKPTIDIEGEYEGRSIYYLLTNIFDPRVTQIEYTNNPVTDYQQRYNGYGFGFDYMRHYEDLMYRMLFDARPGRQEPRLEVVYDVLANMIDISRMLGIYYTALTMKQARDPQMNKRARFLDMRDSFTEMSSILADLPLPKFLAQANAKFIRLMDVADGETIQNVGFLVTGDFNAFMNLYSNVRQRREALSWMRVLYPVLGSLGDPGSSFDADVYECFINANFKASPDNFCVYTGATGATELPQQLASGGLLHCVSNSSTNQLHTITGWCLPGTGFGGSAATRYIYPYMCTWDETANTDAAITRTAASGPVLVGPVIQPARLRNDDLSANVFHEYCINRSDNQPNRVVTSIDASTGLPLASADSTHENTRYRVSAGLRLSKLSYTYDINQLTLLASVIAAS
jgi:hypothetical protein